MSDTTSTAPASTTTATPAKAPAAEAPKAAPAAAPATTAKPAKAPEPKVPPADASSPPPKPPPKADEWAKLSAEEKRVAKVRADLENERKTFAEQRKAAAERDALIEKAKSGDWEARTALLRETGLTYDEWTKHQLRSAKADPNAKLAKEIEDLKAERQREREEAAKRAEAEAWAGTIAGFKTHVTVESPDDFPLLAGELEADPPLIDATLRSMERLAREQGSPITIRDAALKMEAYFRAQTERRMSRLPPKTTPEPSSAPAQTSSTKTRPRDQQSGRFASGDGPRTLTNDLSAERSTPAKGRNEPGRKLTMKERDDQERERLRRAANALG